MSRGRSPTRRGKVAPAPPPTWKQWLGAVLFLAGGGAFAAWGVHDMTTWFRALRDGAATVETASALLGIVPLGSGIALLSPLLLVPASVGGWRETVAKVVIVGALLLSLGGVLLATVGSLGVTAVMRHHGYHVCDVWHGTRMSVTTWAARDRACPAES